ncbi:MarR family winged helix-turn-helix transcriptional regulator [Mycolicibacterium vaccae]|uniref:MarR family winged helix-turn-helix transcriptional regulator n=1 Tax=Mycolicibacterium vaccae TaxID=1810 RepID=UPI003CFE63A5
MKSAKRRSIRDFRESLRRRHGAEGGIDQASAERAELLFNLTRTVNRLSLDFEQLHRRNGLSWSGFRIMNVIWVVEDVEVSEIARLSGASRASTWSALNTLERNGLVQRSRDAEDRRMVRATLTASGVQVLEAAVQAQAEREAQWFSVLDQQDQRILKELLARLADQASPAPRSDNQDTASS